MQREVGTNGPSTLVQSAGSFSKPFTFVWAFYPRYIPSRTLVTMKRITTFLHEIDKLSSPRHCIKVLLEIGVLTLLREGNAVQ